MASSTDEDDWQSGVEPLAESRRRITPERPRPALAESLRPISPEEALEPGEELAFLRPGLSAQILRQLRRGQWVVEAVSTCTA